MGISKFPLARMCSFSFTLRRPGAQLRTGAVPPIHTFAEMILNMLLTKTTARRFSLLAITLLVVVGGVSQVNAATCTDGVDCYCDRVRKPSDPLYDPNVLVCEDFEAITLYEDLGPGNKTNAGGQNVFGPWYDSSNTFSSGFWGGNNYWQNTYGATDVSCSVRQGTPTGAAVGSPCAFSTCAAKEWRADNRWGTNQNACIDIQRAGDANDEIASLRDLGVHDGRQILAHRIQAGHTVGILGNKAFSCNGGPCTELGVTMAQGYSSNSAASGIWNSPWKHDEWGSGMHMWINGNVAPTGGGSALPYRPALLTRTMSESQCSALIRAAAVNRGSLTCGCGGGNCIAYYYSADPNYYNQSRDWPWGTWGCTQGHIRGLGTRSGTVRLWHNGVLIVDISNLDMTVLTDTSFNHLAWNAYANANQGMGATPTNQTTYRYEDNVHARNGAPVSCASIGFGAIAPGSSTPPPPPILLP